MIRTRHFVMACLAALSLSAQADCSTAWEAAMSATDRGRASYDGENWKAAADEFDSAIALWKQVARSCSGENARRAEHNVFELIRRKEKAQSKFDDERRSQSPCGFYWDLARDIDKKVWVQKTAEAAHTAAASWRLAATHCSGEDALKARSAGDRMEKLGHKFASLPEADTKKP